MRSPSGARGFTLLEVLLGIGILGLGVVSALQVFGSSVQLARAAARKSEAVVHAKALMDSALWSPELRVGQTNGVIGDGYRWVRAIRLGGPEDGMPPEDENNVGQSDLRLAVISVVVEWDDSNGVKSYRIGTMRIVPNNG